MIIKRSGQVGLVLLVLMGLVIGIALSLAQRSLSDTAISRQETESSKAFRLAENGIEEALNEIRTSGIPGDAITKVDGTFSGTVTVAGESQYGLLVKEGEQAYLDLTGFVTSNDLTILWGKKSSPMENVGGCSEGSGNAPAALEIMAINSSNEVDFEYYNAYGCALGNGFASSLVGNDEYISKVIYDVVANTTQLRIRALYNTATISVSGATLGTQLYVIAAQAEGGDARKEISVKRGLDTSAAIFDYALFSGSTIVK